MIESLSEMDPHLPSNTLFKENVAKTLTENARIRRSTVNKGHINGLLQTVPIILDDGEHRVNSVMDLSVRARAKLVVGNCVMRFSEGVRRVARTPSNSLARALIRYIPR